MPSNIDGIYTKNVKSPIGVSVTAANVSSQGGGTIATDIFLIATSDVNNGSFARRIRCEPTASAASTTTTATVARFFISSQSSGATTSANTVCIGEITLPSVVAAHPTIPVFPIDFPINDGIGANLSLLVTNHAAPAASTAWRFTLFYGDY